MIKIIEISIDYSKFETVIKIDIKQRTELSIIPTFSVRIADDLCLNKKDLESSFKQYWNDLFDKNFTSKSENNNQYSNKEIFGRNKSRKILFKNGQHKDLNRFLALKLGNQILNLSSFSRSYNNLFEFSITQNILNYSTIYPTIYTTFVLDIESLEKRTDKQERKIFSILFGYAKYRKFKGSFIKQKLNLYLHSNSFESFKQKTEKLNELNKRFIPGGLLYKLIGTKHIFIENGKEICSHYNSNYRPFNAFSQSVCLRKCYQNYCQKRFKCSPLVIKEIISSIDEMENEPNFCSKELNDICEKAVNEKNISNQCTKYCPKDCIQFDYQYSKHKRVAKESIEETELVWDTYYPLISYIETRVITFTDYLCYCGGLLGLWFGSNANSVITYALNLRNWISLKNKSLYIIWITKDKFMSIFQVVLSAIWRIIIIFIKFYYYVKITY